jgi:hypothetical protein
LEEGTPGVEDTSVPPYLLRESAPGMLAQRPWIFKAIPAAQVCERARIAALPLQEIGSRLVLPGLVVFELGRGGNGVGVIRKEQIGVAAMGNTLSVRKGRLVHLISSRQMCLEDFC